MAKNSPVAKSGPTLFAIAEDAMAIERLVFEEGGELSETLEAWLAEVDTMLSQKADAYEFAMAKFAGTEVMLKEKAAKFLTAASALKNARERMNQRIKDVMIMANLPEVRGEMITFKLVKGQKIRRIDPTLLPDVYKKERQITEQYIDEQMLQVDIETNREIPGVSFDQVYQLRKAVSK